MCLVLWFDYNAACLPVCYSAFLRAFLQIPRLLS
jgi:hypothetical protein